MKHEHLGWMVGVAAMGMMFGLMGNEVSELATWGEVFTPGFVGRMCLHASVVIATGGSL